MTINETSFFRDSRPFELLRTELLPKLIEARRHARSLRFWSAACSTGQEAYSLAMLMLRAFSFAGRLEHSHRGHRHLPAKWWSARRPAAITASRSTAACPRASWCATSIIMGEDWVVKPEVKKMCNFRQANLCGPQLPFNRADDRFDVIFLRNVMLYFSQETRKTLLANIHQLLAPDGILFLGSSEQPADPSIWTPVLAGGTCYFRPRQPS